MAGLTGCKSPKGNNMLHATEFHGFILAGIAVRDDDGEVVGVVFNLQTAAKLADALNIEFPTVTPVHSDSWFYDERYSLKWNGSTWVRTE